MLYIHIIWLSMNMWFHIWTMVYFLIYNVCVYIYICAHVIPAYKYIYINIGRYLVHKNCNQKGEDSSAIPTDIHMTLISPSGCTQSRADLLVALAYVRAAVYVSSCVYIYTHMHMHVQACNSAITAGSSWHIMQRWRWPPFLVMTSAKKIACRWL